MVCSNLNVPNLENLCIEIRKPNSKPFLIVSWYRPPCSSIDLFLYYESFLEQLDSLGLEYHLLGEKIVTWPFYNMIQLLVTYLKFLIYLGFNNFNYHFSIIGLHLANEATDN